MSRSLVTVARTTPESHRFPVHCGWAARYLPTLRPSKSSPMRDAFRFLTLAGPRRGPASPGAATLLYFPVVGVVVALCWAAPGWVFGPYVPSAGVTAAAVLLVDAIVTGGIHLTALADVADGAASGRRDDEGIAIMRDPVVGAMGVVVIVLGCLLRYGALTFSAGFGFRLFAAPVVGRAAMVLLIAWLPPLQDGSVAHLLHVSRRPVLAGAAVLTMIAVLPSGAAGFEALGFGLTAAVLYGSWFRGRFSDMSRDGINAACLVAETVALVTLSAS